MGARHARLWKEARTFADLGELTAQWIEGRIDSHPGCIVDEASDPDEETRHLVPILAACNRRGFVTMDSQPGMAARAWGGGFWEQRATVCGLVEDRRLLRDLKRAAGRAGLIVIAHGPGKWDYGADRNLAITKVDGRDCTWAGQKMERFDRAYEWAGVSRGAIRRITAAWQVIVIDPEWGRDDRLWPALHRVVG